MFFTDTVFFIFLPVVVLFYWLLPHKAQNLLLLAASYIFYTFAVPWTGWLMLAVTSINYCAALLIEKHPEKRPALLVLCIALSLSFLLWFKYAMFIAANLALVFPSSSLSLHIFLPVGISFYTFQALAYTGDVYNGRLKAERNPIDFFLFISFFPQLVAGPIERAENLLRQIKLPRSWDGSHFMRGIDSLLMGFVKKVAIADSVAVYVNMIFDLQDPSTLLIFVGCIGFSVQILADFSAYTDIARGCARLMGLELMENFNHPYISRHPAEFWRRWHISLSNCIRDHLYFPLGGSRVPVGRWMVNVLFVWIICGLWHGAGWNYIAFGLFWGCLLIADRFITVFPDRAWATIPKIAFTYFWVILSFLLFRVQNLAYLGDYFSKHALELSARQLPVATVVLAIMLFYASRLFWPSASRNLRYAAGPMQAACSHFVF